MRNKLKRGTSPMSVLRLILGDQLSPSISSLKDCNKKNDIILMCEIHNETTYVKHHKKKIIFLFSAMRHFSDELAQKNYHIEYIKLDDTDNTGSFTGEVKKATKNHAIGKIVVTEPGEYRVLQELKALGEYTKNILDIDLEIRPDTRFLCSTKQFFRWSKQRKQLRMEYFYRFMREQQGILMNGPQPCGGQWNYDSENRKPPKNTLDIPAPYVNPIDPVTREVMMLVAHHCADHFGEVLPFHFAVTRKQALEALESFITQRLKNFGDYQDAMLENEPWMYHSHLSFYLNCGLLLPLECIQRAEEAYRTQQAPLNAVEGFIRQILGWREYVRGIYWLNMPTYAQHNFLNATRSLPWFYWTGNTKMNCIRQCVTETKKHAYAHHIQRLMVLGNFALLAGVRPNEVNEWYLIVYADAYEWVELPNVTGMILFADGGYLASKPYASGGSYINKMSNYCQSCHYKIKQKTGADACPFNYLYWNFLAKNRDKLQHNPRLTMMYRTYDRMSDQKKACIAEESAIFLTRISQKLV